MKVNDIVKMQYPTLWWNKGAVGHIVRIDHDTQGEPIYLICFDSSCHRMDNCRGLNDHCFWAGKYDVKLYRQNKLMKVE